MLLTYDGTNMSLSNSYVFMVVYVEKHARSPVKAGVSISQRAI